MIKEFLHAKIIEHTKNNKKMHVFYEYVYRLLGIHTATLCTAGWLISNLSIIHSPTQGNELYKKQYLIIGWEESVHDYCPVKFLSVANGICYFNVWSM